MKELIFNKYLNIIILKRKENLLFFNLNYLFQNCKVHYDFVFLEIRI